MSELTDLYAEIAVCQRCPLGQSRTHTVPGEGPENAEILFVGEGPGFHEDQQGRPFVGAAGKFLEELLTTNGLKREQVYITNVIKCRPPGNRDPQPDEIETCRPYLDQQIGLIQPKVIVTLGRYSMERFFPGAKISQVHGKAKRIGNVIVVPMYHPAAALHQPRFRADIEADFKKLPQVLKDAEKIEGEQPKPPKAEQLSLF